MLSATELLAAKSPEAIFDGDLNRSKHLYREMVLRWHPDRNPGDKIAEEVFKHVATLYELAVSRIESGKWEGSGMVRLISKTGDIYRIAYLRSSPFELGHQYIGDDHVYYVLDEKHKDLFNNAVRTIQSGFKYASDSMRKECSRYLPGKGTTFQTQDGRYVIAVFKTPDLLRLRDVLSYYGTSVEPRHTAWILNSLYNLACYLSYTGIVHHDISLDSYFVSPKYHSGALLGGWWYATPKGETIRQVPSRTFDCLPWDAKLNKVAAPGADLELIRATGRELLGSLDGSHLLDTAPQQMKDWLRSVSSGKATEDYASWSKALDASFGPRKFVRMELDAVMLYKPK